MRELHTVEEVVATSADPMLHWAAQALLPDYPYPGGTAWQHGTAVAVYAPGLNRRNRLLYAGEVDDATELLATVLPDCPPTIRPLAGTELARAVAARLPELVDLFTFGWMDDGGRGDAGAGHDGAGTPSPVRWLAPEELPAATDLLKLANPDSYVWPGEPGARRWAGVFSGDGELVAVAADAWSTPGVGFLAGVATHPGHRGRGLGRAVCSFVVDALRAEYGLVALMVNEDNDHAVRLYTRLGLRYRSVTALGPVSGLAQRTGY
ncbi:MAG TPA: GNAT family N-acetyltransferase [Pseudonocardiaceae bacterium]